MGVRGRILSIRLIEKQNTQAGFMKEIGVAVEIKKKPEQKEDMKTDNLIEPK